MPKTHYDLTVGKPSKIAGDFFPDGVERLRAAAGYYYDAFFIL